MSAAPAADVNGYDAVIVGGGPRGVATVLRLAARVRPGQRPARVAIVDAIEIGPGATWRTDQPAAYLNNTLARTTTIHPDESTPMSGPPAPGPDLVEWAAGVVAAGGHPFAPWVLEEARALRPGDFPTRRLQGVYFRDQLDAAIATGRVEVDEIIATAIDVETAATGGRVLLRDGRELTAPTIVLAQGMVQALPTPDLVSLDEAARAAGLVYIAPGMPAEQEWHELHARVPAGETVIVRGLGANFFDVVGWFAEEWGGRFEPVPGDPHGRLRYLPTGRELRLVAGSRRGIPYRSKPDDVPVPGFVARYATPDWFARLRERRGVDFRDEVWPVIAKDLGYAHLDALDRWAPEVLEPEWRERLDAARTVPETDAVLLRAVRDPRHVFLIDHLRRPTAGRRVSPEAWRAYVERLVDDELGSMSEPARHPRAAVNRAMGALRGPAAQLVPAGAISGESAVRDVQGWFDGDGLFLASGPPSQRVRRILALIEAGIVELLGPETAVGFDAARGLFRASSAITGSAIHAQALVETRMSKGKIPRTNDPLMRALLDTGRARIHRIDDSATSSIEATGAVADEAVTSGHNLVAADGSADPAILVLGIPALSTQPGSAIGATPGKPSPLLAGADVAAKQILQRRAE